VNTALSNNKASQSLWPLLSSVRSEPFIRPSLSRRAVQLAFDLRGEPFSRPSTTGASRSVGPRLSGTSRLVGPRPPRRAVQSALNSVPTTNTVRKRKESEGPPSRLQPTQQQPPSIKKIPGTLPLKQRGYSTRRVETNFYRTTGTRSKASRRNLASKRYNC